MTQSISVPLIAKTPLWTGGANPKNMDYLKSTSFLGGLRFWTEALLRSQGNHVCPEQERCTYDPDGNQCCTLCSLFGCTGLGRGFALKVEDKGNPTFWHERKIILKHRTHTVPGKGGTETKIPRFFLKPGIKEGFSFNIALRSLRPGVDQNPARLALHLVIHWGALGAQDQYGYGYASPDGEDILKKEVTKISLSQNSSAVARNRGSNRPDLRDFFFFTGTIKGKQDQIFERISWNDDCPYPLVVPLEMRCRVRENLRKTSSITKEIRHQFCGNVQGGAHGSRYNMGLIDKTIYGWGWYPRSGNNNADRNTCLEAVKTELSQVCTNSRWKEFSSARDNCKSPNDWPNYLRELRDIHWR